MTRRFTKTAALFLAFALAGALLTGCGDDDDDDDREEAYCVDRENNIIDPAQCQRLQVSTRTTTMTRTGSPRCSSTSGHSEDTTQGVTTSFLGRSDGLAR